MRKQLYAVVLVNLTPHLFLVSYRWPSLIWKYPAIHCNGAHVITFLLCSWRPWVLWLDARPKVISAKASKLQMMEMKLMLTWHGHGHWVSQDWENQSCLSFLKQSSVWSLLIIHFNSCRKYREKAGSPKAVSPRAFRKQDHFRWKLYENKMAFIESSTKAGWLSLKALWKQEGFRWKLYEWRMAFFESSTKEGWLSLKALRKQDGFRWEVYESRMAFVESSRKAGWLSLKAQRKKDGFRWELYERRMAFVESPVKAFQKARK